MSLLVTLLEDLARLERRPNPTHRHDYELDRLRELLTVLRSLHDAPPAKAPALAGDGDDLRTGREDLGGSGESLRGDLDTDTPSGRSDRAVAPHQEGHQHARRDRSTAQRRPARRSRRRG